MRVLYTIFGFLAVIGVVDLAHILYRLWWAFRLYCAAYED